MLRRTLSRKDGVEWPVGPQTARDARSCQESVRSTHQKTFTVIHTFLSLLKDWPHKLTTYGRVLAEETASNYSAFLLISVIFFVLMLPTGPEEFMN